MTCGRCDRLGNRLGVGVVAAGRLIPDDPGAVARLLNSMREAGADEQAAALLRRNPAARVSLDDPGAVARLSASMRRAGADEQAAALAARARRPRPLVDPDYVAYDLSGFEDSERLVADAARRKARVLAAK